MSERQTPAAGPTRSGKSKSRNAGSAPWAQALKAAKPEAPQADVRSGLQSPGETLQEKTRGEFEQRFAHDFGSVRVHADRSAAESAEALQANAYTAGSDIVFGAGQYQPQSERGRDLLAHELAHVAQQREPTTSGGSFQISRPGSTAERAAEASAKRVTAGLNAPAAGLAAPGVIYRDIKEDLKKAIAGWGTDEEAIYARIRNSTDDEKKAVVTDPVLMQDLQDDLSRGEWGKVLGLLGGTAESVHIASEGWGTDEEAIFEALRAADGAKLKQQLETSTILLELRDELDDDDLTKAMAIVGEKYARAATVAPADTFHMLVVFPEIVAGVSKRVSGRGINLVTNVIRKLPRGHNMPASTVDDVNAQIENDNSLARVEAAFEARWNLDLTAKAKGTGPVPKWTVSLIRKVHRSLRQLPPGHVVRGEQDVAGIATGEVAAFELSAIEPHMGFWDANRGTIIVGEEFGNIAGLTRHEVGHAIDSFLGTVTTNFKKNSYNGWDWSGSSETWAAVMPDAWKRKDGTEVPDPDKAAIKAHLDTYVQGKGTGSLKTGAAPGHAIHTYWSDDVRMIEAAKALAGKKDNVWKDLGSVKKYGSFRFSWSTYYHEFYVYKAVVQDKKLTDYQFFGHPEFFAEMYEAYYEEGAGPERGKKLAGVSNWKQFFDNTVHSTVGT